MSKTLVIGGGLLGLCTAKALADKGIEVEVLEAREAVGMETSFANGGMLTPSLPDPWNAPGVYRHLVASLFDPKSSMKLHLSSIPSLLSWGLGFLRNSSPGRFYKSVESNYHLARYSLDLTAVWRERLQFDYCAGTVGSLKVFRAESAMAGPLALAERLGSLGLRYEQLDAEGALALEPALEDIREHIVGALYFPSDETGDAHLFCRGVADALDAMGVHVHTNTTALALIIEHGKIVGVNTSAGDMRAERIVVAAGPQTPLLLRGTRLKLPIAPAKGYSVTFPVDGIDGLPLTPVIDDHMHAGVVPLSGRLRVVGTAEFIGYNTELSQVRVDNLVNLLHAFYPSISAQLDKTKAEPWTGLRPMSSDGRPFIGESRIKGLWFNAGHGHLGWTKAVGSAAMLADLLAGRVPAINHAPFAVHR